MKKNTIHLTQPVLALAAAGLILAGCSSTTGEGPGAGETTSSTVTTSTSQQPRVGDEQAGATAGTPESTTDSMPTGSGPAAPGQLNVDTGENTTAPEKVTTTNSTSSADTTATPNKTTTTPTPTLTPVAKPKLGPETSLWTTVAANIRSGPGTGHSVVGSAGYGQRLSGRLYGDTGWYYLGSGRYISGSVVDNTKPAPKPKPTPEPQPEPEPAPATTAKPTPTSTPKPAPTTKPAPAPITTTSEAPYRFPDGTQRSADAWVGRCSWREATGEYVIDATVQTIFGTMMNEFIYRTPAEGFHITRIHAAGSVYRVNINAEPVCRWAQENAS